MAIKTIDCSGGTLSLLTPTNYELVFEKIKDANFMCQSVTLPDIQFGVAKAFYSKHDVNLVGEKIGQGTFSANILVDTEMKSFSSIYDWMLAISVLGDATDTTSNCMLKVGGKTFTFRDVFPIGLSNFTLSSILTDTPPITFSATFAYVSFDLK